MSKQLRLYTILALLWASTATAQSSKSPLKFDKNVHDFGTIKEEGGKVSTRFFFKHEGTDSLSITNIIVSCGCTSPDWPKQKLAPGDTGSVFISYDPLDRPGDFDKHIGIEIDGDPKGVVRIHGMVEKRPEGPRDWYPGRLGNLWFKHAPMFLGTVLKDTTIVFENIIYNDSKQAIKIFPDQIKMPSFARMKFSRTQIDPQDTVHFWLTYNALNNSDWGYDVDSISMPSTDTDTPIKPLAVAALLKENFVVGAPAPKMVWASTKIEFGDVASNVMLTRAFVIKNEGQAPLKIHAFKPNCDCLTATLDKNEASAGESITLTVNFNPGDGRGHQRKVITLISNDPKADLKNLIVTADIP